MDKIFVDGLRHHFQMTTTAIDRMFPRLRDLIDIHIRFLLKLRRRQNINVVVQSIADILIDQFSGENAVRMKNAYGDFCSRHRDAVEAYKYYLREDTRFARFVRHCQVRFVTILISSIFVTTTIKFDVFRRILCLRKKAFRNVFYL